MFYCGVTRYIHAAALLELDGEELLPEHQQVQAIRGSNAPQEGFERDWLALLFCMLRGATATQCNPLKLLVSQLQHEIHNKNALPTS